MQITIRTILLAAAILLFVLAILMDENWTDLVALGLAAFAGAFLVESLGVDRQLGDTR
jgi:hypothetical protein